MKTQLLSLSKIFTEQILRIPDYQRGYAWTGKQLKDFWNDLTQLEDGKNHYTGVLTLEEVPDEILRNWEEDLWIIQSKSFSPYYVVDGQQRLTIILIQSIIESIPNEQKLNYTSLDEIRKKFVFETKDEGISRSYVFGYDKDNPSYEFLKTRIFMEKSDQSFPLQETIYTRNLESAKEFFLEKIKIMSIQEIEMIYKKLTQNLLFNIYSISNEVDVFVAFETMNNRGKPLSHLELLKNRLIYLSTKLNAPEYEKTKLRTAVNEAWKSVYHYLGKNKDKPLDDDTFLYNHFILQFGSEFKKHNSISNGHPRARFISPVRRVDYQDYLLETKFTARNLIGDNNKPAQVTIRDIYSYVQSLKESVGIWYQILNPYDS